MKQTKYICELIKRAENGEADAQYSLGFRHETGDGVEQNLEKAVYWYEEALKKKHERAFQRLVFINGTSAIEKAADNGYDKARIILGDMYYYGIGVDRDEKRASTLYYEASSQSLQSFQKVLDRFLAIGYCKSIVENSANTGRFTVQRMLGYMYQVGIGVEQNNTMAVYWYRKSAMQGYKVAQYSLGGMYFNGTGVKQNKKTAAYWYRKSAKQGYANAQYHLGKMHSIGDGVKKDMKKAVYWYEKAAEQEHVAAQRALYKIYKPGKNTV